MSLLSIILIGLAAIVVISLVITFAPTIFKVIGIILLVAVIILLILFASSIIIPI